MNSSGCSVVERVSHPNVSSTTPVSDYEEILLHKLKIWFGGMIALSVFGAINNLLIFIITQRQHHNRQSGSRRLISHFSLAYALMCGLNFPGNATVTYLRQSRVAAFPNGICTYVQGAYLLVFGVSCWTSTLLAVNRVIAVCRPHQYAQWTTRRAMSLASAFCWIFSITCTLTIMAGTVGTLAVTGNGNCVFLPRKLPGVIVLNLISGFPMVLTGVGYVIVGAKLCGTATAWLIREPVTQMVDGVAVRTVAAATIMTRRRLAITRMLFASYMLTIACTVPGFVLTSFYQRLYCEDPMANLYSRAVTLCEFALNPLIFYFVDADYRTGLKLLLGRRPDMRVDNTARLS